MAGSKKARMRSLARHIGEVGSDPFIPARQPQAPARASSTVVPPLVRPARRWGARGRVMAGVALALVGVWVAFFAPPALAVGVRALPFVPAAAGPAAPFILALVAFVLGLVLGVWGGTALRRTPTEDGDSD